MATTSRASRTKSNVIPDTLEANVSFIIKAGPPARVSAVQFQDDAGFPPAH